MNPKDNNLSDNSFRKLVQDENYFRHVFKKTEKIVGVVFYILNNVDSDKKTETHVSNIAGKAHLAHEHALRTLEVKRATGREVLEQFAQSLLALESSFRVAATTGLIAPEVLRTVVAEIDTVLRSLRSYIHSGERIEDPGFAFGIDGSGETGRRKRGLSPAVAAPHIESTVLLAATTSADRRERIKTIIEAKGEASIKDISDIVTDVSEKTIQRELQSMIEDNLIKRQGERRWSRYSIF